MSIPLGSVFLKIVSIHGLRDQKSHQLVDLLPNLWIFRTKNLALERSHSVSGNVFEWRYSSASWASIPCISSIGASCCRVFLQTRGLYLRGLSTHACPLGNGMERIQFIAWSFVLTYLIIRLIFKLQLLGLFTSGLAAVLSFISLFPKALILIIGMSLVTRNYFKTPGLNYMPPLQYLATEFSLF